MRQPSFALGVVGREACCSRIPRGRRDDPHDASGIEQLTTALYAPSRLPRPAHSGRSSVEIPTAQPFGGFGKGLGVVLPCVKRTGCGERLAKTSRVSWVGELAGSRQAPWSANYAIETTCGTVTDRGESASSRLHDPRHLARPPKRSPQPRSQSGSRTTSTPSACSFSSTRS